MTSTSRGRIAPVRRLKVADSVAEQIEMMIARGDYALGDQLPSERVLAEEFGVGRSSMREAIRVLEANGLLRTDHGVGVFVVRNTRRPTDLSELLIDEEFTVQELFEVRLSLERDAAGFAAQRATAADVSQLEGIIAAAAEPGLSDDAFIALDAELHSTIARVTKNTLLLRLFETIAPLFVTYSHQVIGLPGRRRTAHEGHCAIVEAVAGKRVRDARSAAVRHIREVERDILENLWHAAADDPAGQP